MDSAAASDPLQDLAPTAMIGGLYGTFDWTLPQGRVVHDYLAAAGIGAERTTAGAAA
jgi:acetoacetate decarboxylase